MTEGYRKEYRVRLHTHENDDYNELWVTEDNKFIARHTYGRDGIWEYVNDPLGYCELDHSCGEDILFRVCGKNFRELFVSSNREGMGFPCLRFLREAAWNEWKDRLPGVAAENADTIQLIHALSGSSPSALDNWLLSFKDPELYGAAATDYDENWCQFKSEAFSKEVLSTFQYAGEDYCVEKIGKQHTACRKRWYEYYSGGQYVGAQFDRENPGTMYSGRHAASKLTDALKELYPDRRYLSRIKVFEGCAYERKYGYAKAAELLLNNNFHRTFVDGLIEQEREHPSFFSSHEEIERVYPGYVRDWSSQYPY